MLSFIPTSKKFLNKINGVSASTGSLGHGLPIALGKAFAYRIYNKNKKIFCLVGDGELNEGSIWESMLLASHHRMHELVIILDYNHSTDRALTIGDVRNKFDAFGYQTFEVDGNNLVALDSILEKSKGKTRTAIIANTIKGYGLKTMENNPAWHHLSPKGDQLEELKSEIR
jgi:transketolase